MPERTVLIVDDDQAITQGARLRLEAAGYRTLVATDGDDGLKQTLEHLPNAVLLDVRMPKVDGLTALKAMREDPRTSSIPVIMLSASLRDKQQALEAGAQYFLNKPYRGHQMLAALEAVLPKLSPATTK